MPRTIPALTTAIVLTMALAGCGDDAPASGNEGGKPTVVVGFYPLQFLAERIGGDRINVVNLVKPGAEPHDLELTPQQVRQITDAELVIHLSGFQPALDDAVTAHAKGRSFDAAQVQPLLDAHEGEDDEHGKDPHVWLDPNRFAAIGEQMAARISGIAAGSGDFTSLRAALTALDTEYTTGLADCARRDLVTSHAAFGYLAARYKLNQIPISGLSPDAEPTPQRLTEVAKLAREKGVTTIYFETLVSPKIAETLARQVGARADVLDPLEGLDDGASGDYFSVMRDNLGRLKAGLGCR